jgi:hypothetical protein
MDWSNAGSFAASRQTRIADSRLFVQRSIPNELADRLVTARMGDDPADRPRQKRGGTAPVTRIRQM